MINAKMKKSIEKVALVLGFSMFGVVLLEDFRNALASTVAVVLNPLFNNLQVSVVLFVLAAITGAYASLIQKYTMDWELMRQVQDRMKRFQKEFREAQLADNPQRVKKLESQRSDMMKEQVEMSKQQFKPMAYISILSLPLFIGANYIILGSTYTMVFPFWGEQSLSGNVIGPIYYWLYWYFICSIPVSQLIRKFLNIGGI
ncbi:MAG: hypothetical protein LAKADJCE_00443 [Candidatus Argoarchaeum ethanivorans]|uniref:DUF106 domain-containing protein n=1 Tax=Candidatus Argoarchaeum ethanivorans TaxID=2608793 RepID=A0A811TEG0_9EURY|nr:MAG: hypothetical protein LAKADJCE_00443 [Candidatus Argoarchaeum ethanivorans]